MRDGLHGQDRGARQVGLGRKRAEGERSGSFAGKSSPAPLWLTAGAPVHPWRKEADKGIGKGGRGGVEQGAHVKMLTSGRVAEQWHEVTVIDRNRKGRRATFEFVEPGEGHEQGGRREKAAVLPTPPRFSVWFLPRTEGAKRLLERTRKKGERHWPGEALGRCARAFPRHARGLCRLVRDGEN